jgi:hypothetical protein
MTWQFRHTPLLDWVVPRMQSATIVPRPSRTGEQHHQHQRSAGEHAASGFTRGPVVLRALQNPRTIPWTGEGPKWRLGNTALVQVQAG